MLNNVTQYRTIRRFQKIILRVINVEYPSNIKFIILRMVLLAQGIFLVEGVFLCDLYATRFHFFFKVSHE